MARCCSAAATGTAASVAGACLGPSRSSPWSATLVSAKFSYEWKATCAKQPLPAYLRLQPCFCVDLVTCVALDRCGWFLVTGSRDTTCVVWDLAGGGTGADSGLGSGIGALGVVTGGATAGAGSGPSNPAAPKPVQTLYGHDAAVTCVAIMTELDMVVSGSSVSSQPHCRIRDFLYRYLL